MKKIVTRVAPVAVSIVAGYIIREIEFRKYNHPKIAATLKKGMHEAWTMGFRTGYERAVNSTSVRYEHYLEFKKLNEPSV